MAMKFTWLKQAFTEANNEVLDLKRVLGAYVSVVWTGLGGYAVIALHQPFPFLEAATGAAAILGAVGGAIAVARKAESGASNDPAP
jgi:hypothetical protein